MAHALSSAPQPRPFAKRHPFLIFVALAYLWSWFFWGLAVVWFGSALGTLGFYAGGFGPLVAALITVSLLGKSPTQWFKGLFKWRVHVSWYLFAFGFPVVLVVVLSLVYLALGYSLDFRLLDVRMAAYLSTFVSAALIGGGNEEPGWRGFGLGELQKAYGPISATLILGIIWALWHLPLLGLQNNGAGPDPRSVEEMLSIAILMVSITVHAFWYTWLINRTGSVLLCIILHAGYNTANGLLVLVPQGAFHGSDEFILLCLMTTVLIGSVALLLLTTKGRLGRPVNE